MASSFYNDRVGGLELATIDRLCDFLECVVADLFVREISAGVKPPACNGDRTAGKKQSRGAE